MLKVLVHIGKDFNQAVYLVRGILKLTSQFIGRKVSQEVATEGYPVQAAVLERKTDFYGAAGELFAHLEAGGW